MDSHSTIQLIVIIILIILSAFFSSAETAFITVSKIKLRQLVDENNKRAILVSKILDNQSKMLSAILVGNNIVNISCSALVTTFTIRIWGNYATGIATGVLTIFVLIFGEITPKNAATKYCMQLALIYAPVINALIHIFTPIIIIIDSISKVFLRLLGVNENDKDTTSNNDTSNDFNLNNYNNLKIFISEVEKEIMSIKLVLDKMMVNKKAYMNSVELEKFLDNDHEINYIDFIQILRIVGITYPREKVLKILKFIKIENPLKMTLNLLNKKFNQCKITSSEMTNYELEEALNKILSDDKLNIKQILFNKNNNEISQNEFISLLHDKTIYSDDILSELFLKLTNKK